MPASRGLQNSPSTAGSLRAPVGRRSCARSGLRIQSYGTPPRPSPAPAVAHSTPSSTVTLDDLDLLSPFARRLRIASGTPSHPSPLYRSEVHQAPGVSANVPASLTGVHPQSLSPSPASTTQSTGASAHTPSHPLNDPFLVTSGVKGTRNVYALTPPPSTPSGDDSISQENEMDVIQSLHKGVGVDSEW